MDSVYCIFFHGHFFCKTLSLTYTQGTLLLYYYYYMSPFPLLFFILGLSLSFPWQISVDSSYISWFQLSTLVFSFFFFFFVSRTFSLLTAHDPYSHSPLSNILLQCSSFRFSQKCAREERLLRELTEKIFSIFLYSLTFIFLSYIFFSIKPLISTGNSYKYLFINIFTLTIYVNLEEKKKYR